MEVKTDAQVILEIGSFKNLGSIIQGNREINDVVTCSIGVRCEK